MVNLSMAEREIVSRAADDVRRHQEQAARAGMEGWADLICLRDAGPRSRSLYSVKGRGGWLAAWFCSHLFAERLGAPIRTIRHGKFTTRVYRNGKSRAFVVFWLDKALALRAA